MRGLRNCNSFLTLIRLVTRLAMMHTWWPREGEGDLLRLRSGDEDLLLGDEDLLLGDVDLLRGDLDLLRGDGDLLRGEVERLRGDGDLP